jgi:hypothetical protein
MLQPVPREGTPLLSLSMPGDPMQRLVAPNLFRIVQAYRALQPNIIVAITPGPFGLLGLYYAWRHGIPFISAFHNDFEQLEL